MNVWYSFLIAFAMYSRIPVPTVEWTKERMRYVMCFFPFVGLAEGANNIAVSSDNFFFFRIPDYQLLIGGIRIHRGYPAPLRWA